MSKLSSAGGAIALSAVLAGNNYLALLTSPPNDATSMATMVEVNTPGYARQPMPGSNWTVPIGQPVTSNNIASIAFGFTVSTVLISWIALVSTSSGTAGTFLMYWTLNAPQAFPAGQTLTIPSDSLVMSIA